MFRVLFCVGCYFYCRYWFHYGYCSIVGRFFENSMLRILLCIGCYFYCGYWFWYEYCSIVGWNFEKHMLRKLSSIGCYFIVDIGFITDIVLLWTEILSRIVENTILRILFCTGCYFYCRYWLYYGYCSIVGRSVKKAWLGYCSL